MRKWATKHCGSDEGIHTENYFFAVHNKNYKAIAHPVPKWI